MSMSKPKTAPVGTVVTYTGAPPDIQTEAPLEVKSVRFIHAVMLKGVVRESIAAKDGATFTMSSVGVTVTFAGQSQLVPFANVREITLA